MAKSDDNEFNLEAYRLTPQLAAKLAEARPKIQPRKRLLPAKPEAFVQLPYKMALTTAGRRDASLAVLVELAHQAFKTHQNVVPLANAKLVSVGIGPNAKVRALRHLEADGLVSVDWRGGRKTPHVTLLWIT
jgi:hypothetical protein